MLEEEPIRISNRWAVEGKKKESRCHLIFFFFFNLSSWVDADVTSWDGENGENEL